MDKKFVTIDGNEAAAHMAYQFSEVAAMYPITPSSPMAAMTDAWSAKGRKNIFGQPVKLVEMQSEAGAIGAIHGAIQTGSLAVSYTSSQGLMLMVPVLYRIAGERLPAVLHVASRTVGTHGMSIFGDHSDVMACRDTGFALMSTGSVQEVADLTAVAHLAAIKSRIPFMHFFDGFRTSHEINKVELPDEKRVAQLLDLEALKAFKDGALNPEHPTLRNTVQNGDVYFQIREANNTAYKELPDIVEYYFEGINKITGRQYHLFNYYGDPQAEDVVIAMGSVSGAAREAVDVLMAQNRRAGYIQVHLYRPFSAEHFMHALPKTVKRITVLDRCKAMGSVSEPLYEDVCAAVISQNMTNVKIYGGRYGLSSKDTEPGQIIAAFDNMQNENPVNGFTVGINDDVTHLSLPVKPFEKINDDTIQCKFWGLGGDGTVGANHNTVKIINETTDKYGQAYFEYDAKKSFGITKSHLKFSGRPIEGSYYVKKADFVGCHNQSFLNQYDIVDELKEGGILLLNCSWRKEELEGNISNMVLRQIARKKIKFYTIDATAVADRLGLGAYTNTILQSAFFALMKVIPKKQALEEMKNAIRKTYYTKGDEVIAKNLAAIDAGDEELVKIDVPESWLNLKDEETENKNLPYVVENILFPINRQKGDDLPVSTFTHGYEDGHMDLGMTAYEKRGIAVNIPSWDEKKCIQCNRCALVCPHAVIRPYLLNEEEALNAPAGTKMADANGAAKGYRFTMQISAYDCTGCGSCAESCPAKEKALVMVPAQLKESMKEDWDYFLNTSEKGDIFNLYSVKGSQFKTPLVEFSAACAGCGETPYAKLLTQLFGDRIYWANGTGCSQAWGAPMPGIPYTTNKRGFGPAYTNSLFENNAELTLGMLLSVKQQRNFIKERVMEYEALTKSQTAKDWLSGFDDFEKSRQLSDRLIDELLSVEACQPEPGKATALGSIFAAEDSINYPDRTECEEKAADIPEGAEFTEKAADIPEGTLAGCDRLNGDCENENSIPSEAGRNALQSLARIILRRKDQLAKKTFWMYGGDGWAYDIGFGGLDHVIATGEDINVFVIDTEVYSNTGGQSSKATPIGAVAQFASSGKSSKKKDLGAIFRTYGNVYVAQVAMGADPNQLVTAIKEAENHKGPSVIISYCPCTAHGIKAGMNNVQLEMKKAVEAGYWILYRYNPENEHPMKVDSKKPVLDYETFLDGETRYAALKRTFPENAKKYFKKAAEDAEARYAAYKAQELL